MISNALHFEFIYFFFNDTATTEIYTLSLHDALPISPAVLGLQRLAVVGEGNPGLAAGHVLEREIRRVAAVAEGHHVLGARLDAVEQDVERDAGPGSVELRPLGHAVDVLRDRLARQRLELLPGPRHRLVDGSLDREAPPVQRVMRRRPGREHREVVGHVLPGRDARRIYRRAAPPREAA